MCFYDIRKCFQPNIGFFYTFVVRCSVLIYLGYQVVYSWFTLLKKMASDNQRFTKVWFTLDYSWVRKWFNLVVLSPDADRRH